MSEKGPGNFAPSCPKCTARDATRERGPKNGVYWLCSCGLLYSGSPQEWERMTKTRDQYKRDLERRASEEARTRPELVPPPADGQLIAATEAAADSGDTV